MFRYLRVKSKPEIDEAPTGTIRAEQLEGDSASPIRLGQLNNLPENIKRRLYRGLIPLNLLLQNDIDPITWKDSRGNGRVFLNAAPETGIVRISVRCSSEIIDEFLHLEIADNAFGGVDLNFLILSDPDSERFQTDFDPEGNPTLFGTVRRNLEAERLAMLAGLTPGQVRQSSGASKIVIHQLDIFLGVLGQRALFLEPLSYASAWVFERRGFAYVRGHKLMDDIHAEFQPGGKLYNALDGSTPFRQLEQWKTVRGRAWAIHDGILEAIEARWDKLRMVKQIGRHAGVETFPGSTF